MCIRDRHNWKATMGAELGAALAAEAAAMKARMVGKMKRAAMEQLVGILARGMHGEAGERVRCWHTVMLKERHSEDKATEIEGVRALMATSMRSAATKQFQAILVRILKGELGLRLHHWNQATKHQLLTKAITHNLQHAGIKMLYVALVRLMKGEIGGHFHSWRLQQRAHKRETAKERLRQKQAADSGALLSAEDALLREKLKRHQAAMRAIHRFLRDDLGLMLNLIAAWKANLADCKTGQARALCSLSIFQHVGHVFWMMVGVLRRHNKGHVLEQRKMALFTWKCNVYSVNAAQAHAESQVKFISDAKPPKDELDDYVLTDED
eukprot:TRINITY_DN7285_c0_g1_i3.p1 TRINITY_DN7285_c0_g1~~TRINITY_DN7285_c0_g1_i3.p1  ORF type:complete len:324 (+),score=84.59 TRINITY_DN7285_c0_g1_i3:164-1135(+)